MELRELELDLTESSTLELEQVKLEIEQFFQSKAFQYFHYACDATRVNLMDMILGTTLRGIESLFTRESLMGSAQEWKNVKDVFHELLEDITNEIKSRK